MRVLRRYVELGGNFLDTAEVYGPHKNEELLGRFLREVPREKIVVATKFGFRFGELKLVSFTAVRGGTFSSRSATGDLYSFFAHGLNGARRAVVDGGLL